MVSSPHVNAIFALVANIRHKIAQGGLCRKGGLETGFYAVAKTDVKITAGFEAKLGDKEFPLAEIPLSVRSSWDYCSTPQKQFR